MIRIASLLLTVACTLSACAAPTVEDGSTPSTREPRRFGSGTVENRVTGEYIIGLSSGADPRRVQQHFAEFGVAEWRPLRSDTYLLRLHRDPGLAALTGAAKSAPDVRYIEPNRVYTLPR